MIYRWGVKTWKILYHEVDMIWGVKTLKILYHEVDMIWGVKNDDVQCVMWIINYDDEL